MMKLKNKPSMIFSLSILAFFFSTYSLLAVEILGDSINSKGLKMKTAWGEVVHDANSTASFTTLRPGCLDSERPRPILKHISSLKPGATFYSQPQYALVSHKNPHPIPIADKIQWLTGLDGRHEAFSPKAITFKGEPEITLFRASSNPDSPAQLHDNSSSTYGQFYMGKPGSGSKGVSLRINGCSEKGGEILSNNYCSSSISSAPKLPSDEVWLASYTPSMLNYPNCSADPEQCFKTKIACIGESNPVLIFALNAIPNYGLSKDENLQWKKANPSSEGLDTISFLDQNGNPRNFKISFDMMLADFKGGDPTWYGVGLDSVKRRNYSTAHFMLNIYMQNLKYAPTIPNTGRGQDLGFQIGLFDARNRPRNYDGLIDYADPVAAYFLKRFNTAEIPFGSVKNGVYHNPFSKIPVAADSATKTLSLNDVRISSWTHFPNLGLGDWNFTPFLIESFRASAISGYNKKTREIIVHGPLNAKKQSDGTYQYDKSCYPNLTPPYFGVHQHKIYDHCKTSTASGSCCTLEPGTPICQHKGQFLPVASGLSCSTGHQRYATDKDALSFYSLSRVVLDMENSSTHNLEVRLKDIKLSY